jgi:hypothetical protein
MQKQPETEVNLWLEGLILQPIRIEKEQKPEAGVI